MNDHHNHPTPRNRGAAIRKVLIEAVLVAAAGAVVAFAANRISPHGLALSRNYFPGATNASVAAPILSPFEGLKEKGLQWVDAKGALQRFNDPRFKQQRVVFIDARDEDQYREGHIPGSYELDAYHPERNLAAILPVCQAAEEIVVYCNGGGCEDSEFAAVTFRDAGIPNLKLFVYAGGMAEWKTNGLPVETGEQNSGTMRAVGK